MLKKKTTKKIVYIRLTILFLIYLTIQNTNHFLDLFSLSCPKQPISNRPDLKRLNREANIAHCGIKYVRIVIQDDAGIVEKMTTWLTALRD